MEFCFKQGQQRLLKMAILVSFVFLLLVPEHVSAVSNSTSVLSLRYPAANSVVGQDFDVEFTLPEVARLDSVKLTFTRSGGSEDIGSPHVVTFVKSFAKPGTHKCTLQPLSHSEKVGFHFNFGFIFAFVFASALPTACVNHGFLFSCSFSLLFVVCWSSQICFLCHRVSSRSFP